jgi:hypothetical protein
MVDSQPPDQQVQRLHIPATLNHLIISLDHHRCSIRQLIPVKNVSERLVMKEKRESAEW